MNTDTLHYSNYELRIACDTLDDLISAHYQLKKLGINASIVGAYDLTLFNTDTHEEKK